MGLITGSICLYNEIKHDKQIKAKITIEESIIAWPFGLYSMVENTIIYKKK